MTPETTLQNEIKIKLGEMGYVYLRLNVGLFMTADGRPFKTGLPKGTSDMLFIQPGTGRAVFIESKIRPRKPTKEQIKFIEAMKAQGALAGVAYSVEDALDIIQQSTLKEIKE